MSRMLISAALLLAAPLLAAPLHGQTAPAATVTPEMEAARRIAGKLFPDGTYKQMLGENMAKMMEQMAGSVGDMPIASIARIGGITEEEAKALDQAKLGDIMAIHDPHWRERMALGQSAMFAEMGTVFASLEPRFREGMARAYAREFKLAELQEIERFFATPTGGRYAAKAMLIAADPEVMKEMTEAMPEIVAAMPQIFAAMEKATASLPKPRKFQDLTPAERKRLSELFGVPEDQLSDPEAEEDEETLQSEDPVQ